MNATENLYIQIHHHQGLLINEQSPGKENPFFRIIIPPASLNTHAPNPHTAIQTLTTYTARQYAPQHATGSRQQQVCHSNQKCQLTKLYKL
jgi:hypothetical protein